MQVNSGSGVAAGMLRSCCKEKIQLHSLPTVRNIAKRPLMKAQLFEFFFATLRAPCGRESGICIHTNDMTNIILLF